MGTVTEAGSRAGQNLLTKAKNTVVSTNHLLLEHTCIFSNAFLNSLKKTYLTTLKFFENLTVLKLFIQERFV